MGGNHGIQGLPSPVSLSSGLHSFHGLLLLFDDLPVLAELRSIGKRISFSFLGLAAVDGSWVGWQWACFLQAAGHLGGGRRPRAQLGMQWRVRPCCSGATPDAQSLLGKACQPPLVPPPALLRPQRASAVGTWFKAQRNHPSVGGCWEGLSSAPLNPCVWLEGAGTVRRGVVQMSDKFKLTKSALKI